MSKVIIASVILSLATNPLQATGSKAPLASKPKFSGYIIGQYQANFQYPHGKSVCERTDIG